MSTCKFWTSAAVFIVIGLKFTDGQMPSPEINPCGLYDLKTGRFEIGRTDIRVDVYEGSKQIVILPISGRNNSQLEIKSDDDDLYGIKFSFNGTHNTMSISKDLDRDGISYRAQDDLDIFNFELTCYYTNARGIKTTVFFMVTVAVKDINDNAPTFINTPYFTTIPETQPVLSTVFQLTAMDKDAGVNAEIDFFIQSGNVNPVKTFFDIPTSREGDIVLKSSLDFDSKGTNVIVLTIIAVDNAVNKAERKTSTATLTIAVEDMDDLPPTFYHDKCRLSSEIQDKCDAVIYRTGLVAEQLNSGALQVIPTVIGNENRSESIVAFDTDTLNAAITFEFLDKSQPPGFEDRIQVSTSGPTKERNLGNHAIYSANLVQVKTVGRLEAKIFSLFLKAKQTDDENKYCIAQIEFAVIAYGLFRPVMTTNTKENVGYINEDDPTGTIVRADALGETGAMVIFVTDGDLEDADSCQRYNYEIIDTTGTTGSKFAIQPFGDRAILLANQSFDSSVTPHYFVKVRVVEFTHLARIGEIILQVKIQSKRDSKDEKPGNCACRDGLYGQDCNLTCPANCVRCTSDTQCIECARGFYGTMCNLPCPRKCLLCNKTDGSCFVFFDCEKNNGQGNEEKTYPTLTLILVAVGSIVGTCLIVGFIVMLAIKIRRRRYICCCTENTEGRSGNNGSGDEDKENETQFGNYEGLRDSNKEFKPYDVLKTAEYEELGDRPQNEPQYEGLDLSKR